MPLPAADLLADAGIEDFDAWVGTFAETTTDVEVAPEGGIRVKDRFARFRNIPELLDMWRVAADVKTKEDLKLPVPELAGGKPEVIPVEPSQRWSTSWSPWPAGPRTCAATLSCPKKTTCSRSPTTAG